MAHATRRRGTHGRIQPYAWLGASAVTLGLGMAMVCGTAVAIADAGADASTAADTAAATTDTSPVTSAAPTTKKKPAARASRSSATEKNAGSDSRKGRGSVADALTDLVPNPEAATVPTAAAVAPATAAVPTTRGSKQAGGESAASAAAQANPAAALPAPAAPDPSYNMDSYLPAEPIVPGAHVALAFQNMAGAQTTLNQATWGSNNVVAGLAAVVPQLFLAQAQASLNMWEKSLPAAQQLVQNTVGIPIIHQIADLNLVAVMTLPAQAQFGLGAAALLLPLVNLFGASTAATANLISSARSNGLVYAVVPVQMKATTEPVVGVSIAGGRSVPLLVDTGSSGLITTRDQVGPDLGSPTGTGTITYSGDLSKVYHYTTYNAVVDFGGAAVTEPTAVNIIDDVDAADFKEFLAPAQVTGILGVGANTYGPGPSIPTTALPGELSDGFLLYQNIFLGLFGVMVLGPNPLPTRVSVPGAPDAYVKVSVNGGPQQNADAIIDSGGVTGTLPSYLIGGATPGNLVPAGTKISVYTADGQTLLYSYTTTASNTPYVVGDGDLMNTGYTPFQQGPIYINYAADAAPGGIGSTDFVWA